MLWDLICLVLPRFVRDRCTLSSRGALMCSVVVASVLLGASRAHAQISIPICDVDIEGRIVWLRALSPKSVEKTLTTEFGAQQRVVTFYDKDGTINYICRIPLPFPTSGSGPVSADPLTVRGRSATQLTQIGPANSSGVAAGEIVTADFNGDGVYDVAVADDRAPSIAVVLSKSDGSDQKPMSYEVASTPSSIAVGDVNGDGLLDLVVTSFDTSSYVSILLGNGDGTFSPARNISVGQYPQSVVIGDFNGDGKPDLAVTATDALYILLGYGDGTFQPAAGLPYPGGLSVVAADFNGDGKLDLALAQEPPSGAVALLMLLGNGDGTFKPPISILPGPGIPDDLGFADFNNDGKLDLAISNGYTGTLTILLGKGDGTFQAGNTYLAGGGAVFPTYFEMLDINGDGNLDLFVPDVTSGALTQVLLGNGDGTFQAPPWYPAPNSKPLNPVGVSSLAVADFNGDGKLDVVTSDGSVWLGNGSDQFMLAANRLSPGTFVLAADFDGDGTPDLATSAGIALGNGDGTFRGVVSYPGRVSGRYIVAGDFNGDGKLDVALSPDNPGDLLTALAPAAVSILLGHGDGTFQVPLSYLPGTQPYAIATGDFNGDGKLDLAVANYGDGGTLGPDPGGVAILLGNGDGTFSAGATFRAGKYPSHLAAADWNGDGKLDLVVATSGNGTSGALAVFLGNGDGTFSAQPLISTGNGNFVQWIAAVDLNGDGKLDIVESEQYADVGFFAGNGDGTFQREIPLSAGPNPLNLVAADFNGDGSLDLAVADYQLSSAGGGWTALLGPLTVVTPASTTIQISRLTSRLARH